MKVICVIPAFNEEKTIAKVINDVRPFVSEIIVVDDGSKDKTAEIAEGENVKVLRHLINRDQGAALETGNRYSLSKGAEIIVHFDADGQFLAEEIERVIKPIKDGNADIVFGSRFMGIRSNMPFIKEYFIMPLARVINKIFFNIKMTDPQSGFRAMSADAAKKIKIEQDGKAHCSEIIAKAAKEKLRIVEVPIKVIYNEYGQNFSGGLRIIKDFIIKELIK